MGAGTKAAVSGSYIKSLLAKRCQKNAKASTTVTRRRKRRTGRTTDKADKVPGGITKRRKYRRRRKRRRAPVKKATATTAKPKKQGVEIAIQTMDYPPAEDAIDDGPSASTRGKNIKKDIDTLASSSSKKIPKKPSVKKPAPRASPEVITLSDEEPEKYQPKPENVEDLDNAPSTSTGRRRTTAPRRAVDVFDSDNSDTEAPIVKKMKALEIRSKPNTKPKAVERVPTTVYVLDNSEGSVKISDLLYATPIAEAVAKNLPMKSLNALCQVNQALKEICTKEKRSVRRQYFEWLHRPSIIAALDGDKILTEKKIFGGLFSNIHCEPEFVFTFGRSQMMYDGRLMFRNSRNSLNDKFKNLHQIVTCLLPATFKNDTQVVHIRTHGVIPPIPPRASGNQRKVDHHGSHESYRDFCMLCIPKIEGVNVWRESLSQDDLRKQLRDSGWLANRAGTHFLLPVIKELEPLGPKLVLIFSRRFPNYDHVTSTKFPVLVLDTMDDQYPSGRPGKAAYGPEYGLDWVAFGGAGVKAYQTVIKGASDRRERAEQLQHLRDQFTAQEVMGQRMLIFYFRNVSKFEIETNQDAVQALLDADIGQLREQFPLVPVFGGSYLNVIGSYFTKDHTGNFGKFCSGLHSAVVCVLVLGGASPV